MDELTSYVWGDSYSPKLGKKMSFESLSERFEFQISDFPEQWLPLTHLYDPDLPLFPLQYFHVLDPAIPAGVRPGERDRAYGFIHHVNLVGTTLSVTVALNKNLHAEQNAHLRAVVEAEVRQRLGLGDPISFTQLDGQLSGPLAAANALVEELWHQIIDRQFGKALPFGRLYDGVMGLVRFIASFNSQGGRKGELIQTHYFASVFGERIHTGAGIHVDFFLLPTFEEFTDRSNPLSLFPNFANLVNSASEFAESFCTQKNVGGLMFSEFSMARAGLSGQLDTEKILDICNRSTGATREALFENYNAFNRGPPRAVIALMMFNDLRKGYWDPRNLTTGSCAEMYVSLKGSYQTPKVIQLYAQQCFGSTCALPIDNWVKTFLDWPFHFRSGMPSNYYRELFSCTELWGKFERLIWMASQARKVHSLASAEILWCVRFGGADKKKLRGANPLSCKVCAVHVRNACPAFSAIANEIIEFDTGSVPSGGFLLKTSAPTTTSPSGAIATCEGADTFDEYTVRDRRSKFAPYPAPGHIEGASTTVKDFIRIY
jgi:hypothetical protein